MGYQYKFDIAGTEYGMSDVASCKLDAPMFDKLSVGNACSAELDITFWPKSDIPRMARIIPYVQLDDGSWYKIGVFYTDTRSQQGDKLNIIAYDGMMKADVVWVPDQSLEFPMSMPAAVNTISALMGVELDSRTVLNANYSIDYPANDWTWRDVLGFIAAAHGGNWVMTSEGKLRLIPLFTMSTTHDIGKQVSSFEKYDEIGPITAIALLLDDENEIVSGDESGYTLEASCPYGTETMANDLLSALFGKTYKGFRAENAVLTPTAELGDGVTVNGTTSFIAHRIVTFGPGHMSEIEAPGENTLEHEYQWKSPGQKEFDRKIAQTRSLISKTSEKIMLSIEGLDERVSKIELNEQDITISVSNSETSSTIKLMAGETVLSSQEIKMSGLVTLSALSAGTTTINGACIKTGKISADRIDVGDLKFQTLWGSISKKAIACVENEIYIGGDASTMSYTDVFVRGTGITFSTWNSSASGLKMRPASSILEPITEKNGSIGTGLKPFGEVHCGKLYLNGSEFDPDRSKLYYDSTVYATLNSDKEFVGSSQYYSLGNKTTPWANGYFTKLYLGGDEFRKDRVSQSTSVYAELNASKQFVPALSAGYSMGSIGTPWATGYFTKLYLNGTELTTSASVSKLVNGSNSVELNASKQLVPYTATGYSLGSSSYPFESCYLGKGTIQIGANSLSTGTKIGFYGATPIVRQTLSTSSQNMGFTSATSSNYLTILNNVVGILKKLGLIG